ILSSSLDLCWSPVMSTTFRFRLPPPPVSTLFPYTTLFRSCLFLTALMNASKLTLQGNEWVNHQRFHLTIEKLNTKQMKQLITFRSEEHTSELQSREKLVCRLLLEKKNAGFRVGVRWCHGAR